MRILIWEIALSYHFAVMIIFYSFFFFPSFSSHQCFKQYDLNPLLLLPFFLAKQMSVRKRTPATEGVKSGLISTLCRETSIVKMKFFEGFVKSLLFVMTEGGPFIRKCQKNFRETRGRKTRKFSVSEKSDQKFLWP